MPHFQPIADGTPCTYCGGIALHWDHVVCVRLMRPDAAHKRNVEGDWIVPACAECNGMLSDRMLHNVPLRAQWLYGRYRRKYRKLMMAASWTDDEIEELSGAFQLLVIETRLAQAELDHRLAHLFKVSKLGPDYLRP